MFQQLFRLLPHETGGITLVIAAVGCVLGVCFWLAGARFSRSVLTLAAVALGTGVGMKLPLWCAWSVDGMGPAVGGAVLLGCSAFALHRLWVGICFGAVLTAWGAVAYLVMSGHGLAWSWPAYDRALTLPQYLGFAWQTLPVEARRILPVLATATMGTGIAVALLLPRAGVVTAWSAVGVSLAAMASLKLSPMVLGHLPHHNDAQAGLLCVLTAMGALWQWRSMSSQQTPESGGKPPREGAD